ncbi:MAG: TerC family protein [Candidatus Paracaedimonas acanthamoebae]|uniref:TerC family protein n=1 Tax=Candidatus Paracaedimonas acanthamoebae TaxID=244581 RepID=A0A8J7PS01_9PROT|nr:TerC family protein [Candidatus Paracaedimonas acanthamoebae]
MAVSLLPWFGFLGFITILLIIDLGVLNRKDHIISPREAIIWSCVWIGLALLFNLGIFVLKGSQAGLEFFTGYLIEKSLSLDNIFVFVLIFKYFSLSPHLYHRVLFWGVLGAILMRLVLIFAGLELLERFSWVFYLFGAILVYSGIQMAKQQEQLNFSSHNKFINFIKRFIPITKDYVENHFFIKEQGRLTATPLFLVLLTIEISDLVFAVDSIPAILAVTLDPFIVYTSNIFAILGLRSLFFLIANLLPRFYYLKHALSVVLIFVGCKMFLHQAYKVPIWGSLGIILLIFLIAIIASIRRKTLEGEKLFSLF